MDAMDSRSGFLPADSSLINPEFIRRLHQQRVLYKREVAFHLAEAEKHGAADEALASMIQAAEKVVAIMYPAPSKAADAPDETTTEDARSSPTWREATMAAVGTTAGPTYAEPPTPHGLENLMPDDRAGQSGNAWRTRLLGGRT
jgi:hypothetical protein